MADQPIRILVLEDNPSDAELIQFEIQEAGIDHHAKVVRDGKEYLQAITDFCPDLILSDYDLPTYTGSMALAEARQRCPDTPFILVTGAIVEDRAIEILTQGAKDYVLKGRLQQRLVPAIKRALSESEAQKARKRAEEELHQTHKNLEEQVAQRTAELLEEIERRRQVEKALLRYNERLELLSYTSSRLLASDKPQQLVEELCLKVLDFLDCHAFFNFLVDEAAGRLHLNACAGIPQEKMHEIEWLDFGVAVCGCVAMDGRRIVAEHIPTTPDVRTELVNSFGILAYACHPLMEKGRVLGTLSFGTRSRTTFSMDDLVLMKTVADQVAVAMSRIRTENNLRESNERYRRLVDFLPAGSCEVALPSGRLLEVNDVACGILGYTHDELLAMTAYDLLDDEGKERLASDIRNELTGGNEAGAVTHYHIRTKDGLFISAAVNATFQNLDGERVRATVVAHAVPEGESPIGRRIN